MICKKCNLKAICKTYDFINTQHHATIVVDQCIYNESNAIKETDVVKEVKEPTESTEAVKYYGQAKPDLKEMEKLINNVVDEPAPVIVTCNTCQGKTYDNDLNSCVKCGAIVCSNCGTSYNNNSYCEKCWTTV